MLRSSRPTGLAKPARPALIDVAGYAPFDFVQDPGEFRLTPSYDTEIPGLQVFQTEKSSSECLVFLHGLNGSWMSWTPILQTAATVGWTRFQTSDLVVLDMRRVDGPRTWEQLTRLSSRICERISQRWSDAHLVGHSTGAILAMAIAASQAAPIRSVGVISGGFSQLFEAVRDQGGPSAELAAAVRQYRWASRAGFATSLLLRLADRTGNIPRVAGSMYFDAAALPPGIQSSVSLNFSARAVRDTLSLGAAFPYRQVYSKVTAPVRNVWGEGDPLLGEVDAQQLDEMIPGGVPSLMIPDAGHCAHLERPLRTLAALYPAEICART